MRILFLIPPKINNKWVTREEIRTRLTNIPESPYLLPQISSLLKGSLRDNVNITILDAMLDSLTDEEALQRIDEISPDLIICIVSIYNIHQERKFIELKYPVIAILSPITLNHKEAIELYHLQTPYFVHSNIEATVLEGVKGFIEKKEIKNIRGFLINRNGEIIDTGINNTQITAKLPIPDFHCFRYGEYLDIIERKRSKRSGYMISAKGCIFRCNFCVSANKGEKIICKTPEQVVSEIDYMNKNFGLNLAVLQDPEFSVNVKRAKEILQLLIKKGLNKKVELEINDKPELLNEEYLILMKKAGVCRIKLGIESADSRVLEQLNKKVNLHHASKMIKFAKNLGINITTFFTIGLFGETHESVKKNIDFVVNSGFPDFTTGKLFLSPNSPLYLQLKKEGKLLEKDWTEYRTYNNLCFVHNTYNNIQEMNKAEMYMKRAIEIRRILSLIKKGNTNFNDLIRVFKLFIRVIRLTALSKL